MNSPMVKYPHSVEKSEEYLRLALAQMAKQEAGRHPLSYAIWYEYVSGINKFLHEDLKELQDKGIRLTDEMTEALYMKHVSECDAEVTKRLHNDLEQILTQMLSSAHEMNEQSSHFDGTLEQYSNQLATKPNINKLQDVIVNLISETRTMRNSVTHMQKKLSSSTHELEAVREELRLVRDEAITDELTGLVNRKGLINAMKIAIKASEGKNSDTCLLMADIDHFKLINDKYGHILGDKVLRQIAQVMKALLKGNDTAARYGGEEFAILLPETSLKNAQRVAEHLRAKIEGICIKRMDTGTNIDTITISIGVGRYRSGESLDTLIHRADMALYAAKNNGRNRIEVESSS